MKWGETKRVWILLEEEVEEEIFLNLQREVEKQIHQEGELSQELEEGTEPMEEETRSLPG